jgi:hypothetical protein
MVFLVLCAEFSFCLRFFVLVLVRIVVYLRHSMIYYKVPGPHYCGVRYVCYEFVYLRHYFSGEDVP